ncbi:hypothetical protein KUTeg_008961 [Tegillarca granosa]|uniref:Uncharacterized protein n=1 Tax=Tegillarca granosa TaxID=220873 RepID=A0ABQ9FFF7_TEGGR|nr:hypothetical protein KUTeg_008961 [Tegillarca granosa]
METDMRRFLLIISLLLYLCVTSKAFPMLPKHGRAGNCTNTDRRTNKCKSITHIIEIKKIKGNIIRTSCKIDKNGKMKDNALCNILRNLTTVPTKRPVPPIITTPRPVTTTVKEIYSFSERAENRSADNVLQFKIDVGNDKSLLKAISSHLWIRIKKRRRAKSRSKGKKIFLQISRIHYNDSGYDFLTRIRTRIKKTRWQKISLPITLVQSILDSPERTLKLRIECRKCNREVQPVLTMKSSKRRKEKRRNNRRRRRFKRKRKTSGYRSRNKPFGKNVSKGPFLITRYTLKASLRHHKS